MRTIVIVSVLLPFAWAAAESEPNAWRPELMDPEVETAEALAAGPVEIRDGAGVWLLASGGYSNTRPSSNGFNCLVGRSQPESFEPMCFDEEGSRTLMQQTLMAAELRMSGLSRSQVEAEVAAAWAEGRLRAPGRTGINYMLSPRNKVPVSADTVIDYQPHLMFYAPYLVDADVGGSRDGESPVFMINGGQPDAYVIVPVATE